MALVGGLLVVRGIPYATQFGTVGYGTLKVPVRMIGDVTLPPYAHAVRWFGERPRSSTGNWLPMLNPGKPRGHGEDRHRLICQKPVGREFHDYHELVTSYVNLFAQHAALLDPNCTARSGGGIVREHNAASPFNYVDTASSRAGTEAFTQRLEGMSIAIVGMGGTGSYVLDLVAKTPVATIHLFDDDTFEQHNAFRAPGAVALDDLIVRRAKVDHFAGIYSRLHRGIVPHAERMGHGYLHVLDAMDFVFLCIDEVGPKRAICDRLARAGISFVDTGIGLDVAPDGVFGLVRTTTSTTENRQKALECIPGGRGGGDDLYRTNVQTAELNALNAALAVLSWKRLVGFYREGEPQYQSVLDVESGRLHILADGQ